ncbi:hypothetical protein SAOR_04375 [Salinisphaera orenii MK-B5]|uniref:DUF1249 domain-containing protein n=2 Tax=Salinisphaera orenii TaxID=856731 RepID=A0A423PU08_9GAMM|nr:MULTISPECIES: DUF1249 domain-containing protein [Salinisphaera]ROO29012.1 hypothetical protein SAOR_04375 [Salinisphaera orenii MK-B5]ROO32479.1 hypothetical protein SAHL_05590 [Salinisphaera halophila YIM 95161]
MPRLKRNHWLAAAQPRSFTGLMGLYESNYRRFERLVPEIDLPFDQARSPGEHATLHLRVLERCRYTVTLNLTYWFGEGDDARPDPDLRLRVYRDAQLAEAIYCDARSRYAALAGLPEIDEDVLGNQWPRNLLLNKWLAYCLAQGHSFGGAHRPRRVDAE